MLDLYDVERLAGRRHVMSWRYGQDVAGGCESAKGIYPAAAA
jgi:hypothetical protein